MCGCGRRGNRMLPLHQDPHFTFRFAADRIIPRFHLEGIEAGRRVSVVKIDPSPPNTTTRFGLNALNAAPSAPPINSNRPTPGPGPFLP